MTHHPQLTSAVPKNRIGADETSKGKIAGLYDLEETIGKGHFAVVKLARHVFTGERVAVKVIEKLKLDAVSRAHLYQEVRCMKLVQHPHVVKLYEVIDTQTKLYLVLELGDGGDMYDYIMKHRRGLPEEQARKYFIQILEAINYCHQLHVVHRDLKPENVVFFEKLGIVKLTDFGFSNLFHPGEKLDTSCGSLAYSAPEILLGDSYEAPAVDIWSLGVILYMLVAGDPPFQEANDSETLTMILDCKYKKPSHLSSECLDLISKMLVREPSKRACLSDILNHIWLRWSKNMDPSPESNSARTDSGIRCCPLHISNIAAQNPVELLSEKERMCIIQKMINGKIATKEEILDAISKNNYNHITATYYLLAERKLRREREHANREHSSGSTTPRAHSGGKTSHGASPIRGNSPARGNLASPVTFSKDLRGTLGLSPGRREDSGNVSSPNSTSSTPTAAAAAAATSAATTPTTNPASSSPFANTPRSAMETLISPPGALPAHPNAPGEVRKIFGPRPAAPPVPPITSSSSSFASNAGRFQFSTTSSVDDPSNPHPSSHVERPLRREIHAVKSSPQLLNDVIEEGSETGSSSEEELSDADLAGAYGPITYHTIGSGTPSRKALAASSASSNLGSPEILRSTKMFERKLSSQPSSRTSSRVSSESEHSCDNVDSTLLAPSTSSTRLGANSNVSPAPPSKTLPSNDVSPCRRASSSGSAHHPHHHHHHHHQGANVGSWPRRHGGSSPRHPATAARSASRGSSNRATTSSSHAVQNGAAVAASTSSVTTSAASNSVITDGSGEGGVGGSGNCGMGNGSVVGERSRQDSLASDSGSLTGNGTNPLFLNNNWSVVDGVEGGGGGGGNSAQTPVAILSTGKGSISNISNLSLSSEKSASKYIVDPKRASPRMVKNLHSQRHSPSLDQVYEEQRSHGGGSCSGSVGGSVGFGQSFNNELDRLSERLSIGRMSANSSFHTSASLKSGSEGGGGGGGGPSKGYPHVWTTTTELIGRSLAMRNSLNRSSGGGGGDEGSIRLGAGSAMSGSIRNGEGVCCGSAGTGKVKKVWKDAGWNKKKLPAFSCCAVS